MGEGGSQLSHHGDAVHMREIGLKLTQFLALLFAIFNVRQSSVPLDNISVLIAARNGPNQKPAIFTACTAIAFFILERRAGRQRRSPLAQVLLEVVGVNGNLPG